MLAAGLAEGYLTSKGIHQLYENTKKTSLWDFTNGPDENLTKFMEEQEQYMKSMIAQNPQDPFWKYASLLQRQLEGLQIGYNLTALTNGIPIYKDSWPFKFLNMVCVPPNISNANMEWIEM